MDKLRRRILMLGSVLSLALVTYTGAGAQGGVQVKITQVDNSKFPRVTVYISVTDASGHPVAIDASTIQIFENGEQMQTEVVGGGGQGGVGPLTTMIVMDVSGSMDKGDKINGAKTAAKAFVDQMRSGDQAGIITYNTRSTVVQDLTQDQDALKAAIDGIQTGGDTAMYDAIFKAEEMLKDVQGRKAIIAVTDGLDNSSSRNETDVINAIGPSGVSISTIGLGDPTQTGQPGLDEAGLKSLAQQAGGAYSFAGDSAALAALFQMYARELQSEYALIYTSPSPLRDGVNRNLTVSLSSAGVTADSKYNPGGVIPEVPVQSWILFAALLIGLVALLVIPGLLGGGARLLGGIGGGGGKKGRIKFSGSSGGASASSGAARGRVKIK